MKNCLPLVLVFVLVSCQGNRSAAVNDEQVAPDSLAEEFAYGKEDFDRMVSAFRTDPDFRIMIDTMVAKGDSSAIQFTELLNVPYERRLENTRLTDHEIAIAIYSFKAMQEAKNKFSEIDSTLSRLNDPLDTIAVEE